MHGEVCQPWGMAIVGDVDIDHPSNQYQQLDEIKVNEFEQAKC